MSSVAVDTRIATIGAELEALLVEPLERLSTAERTKAAHQWEALTRRLPAMTHRLVAALADVPTEELGEPTLAAALSTLLRISKAEAHRRIHEAEELGPRATERHPGPEHQRQDLHGERAGLRGGELGPDLL